MKNQFKFYDLHIHTHHSRCSSLKPKQILDFASKKKLDGIAITDHNTIRGALEVKRLNKNKNFEVIIGEEIMTDVGEIIAFYVKKEIKPGKIEEVLAEIKNQRAISCLAHPFATMRNKVKNLDNIKKIDCIEVFNGRNLKKDNLKAVGLAKKHNKTFIGGSDAHFKSEIGTCLTKFKGNLRTAIKNKETIVIGRTSLLKTNYWMVLSSARILFRRLSIL